MLTAWRPEKYILKALSNTAIPTLTGLELEFNDAQYYAIVCEYYNSM